MNPTDDDCAPILTEQITDSNGTYQQEWYCQPPAPGLTYRVTDATWTPDHTVRRIHAIQLGHGRSKR